ncbi:hypothetical transposon protein, partial [Candida dubliniensis CD36]
LLQYTITPNIQTQQANTPKTQTEQDNKSKTYASVAATYKTNLAKSQDKQEELRMNYFKVPSQAFEDLKKHNDAVFPEGIMTSDVSTIINKYGRKKKRFLEPSRIL